MSFLVLATVTCAALLAVSGVAKLRAPEETSQAFVALKLPDQLVRLRVPSLLPWLELLLATLLVVGSGSVLLIATTASLMLFIAYTVVIARALTFEERVNCGCFGALGSHDVTAATLVRNVLLTLHGALAVVAATAGVSIYSQTAASWGWVAMAALAAAVVTLSLSSRGRSGPRAVEQLDWVADAHLAEPGGDSISLRALAGRHGGATLLFLLPGCGACKHILEKLPEWRSQYPDRTVIAVRPNGGQGTHPGMADAYEDFGFNLGTAFGGGIAPAAVELDKRGFPVGPAVTGQQAVAELLGGPARVPEPVPAPEALPAEEDYVRRRTPDAVLLRPGGSPVSLRELAAERAQLLITIDCLCTPVRTALAELEDWQAKLPPLDIRLVSSMKRDAAEAGGGLVAEALYDHDGAASRSLGATGQIAAVLLGADGLLAGGPVRGLDEVREFIEEIALEMRLAYEEQGVANLGV